jgi:[acyl-carrier-protein] S-malonyltransferase
VADKEAVLVVCPGRGSYGKAELGYLNRHHLDKAELVAGFDRIRAARGEPTVSELDGTGLFSVSLHTRGDVASPLIFACSYADFLAIDRGRFEIAAVVGNSMGWYTALPCSGAVTAENGFQIVDAMGQHSQAGEAGGQVLMSVVDEEWREVPGLRERLLSVAADVDARPDAQLFVSIELGGMIVFAGDEPGLAAMLAEAPESRGREPMRLVNHGPFHTPLMRASSERALATLPVGWFASPQAPMVDGRGHVWRPFASSPQALWRYTFETQILETFSFTRAIQVAVKEYAPDRIVLLGPGDSLGGAIAQALIAIEWRGLRSKTEFQELQASDPFLLAMGREEQRALATG